MKKQNINLALFTVMVIALLTPTSALADQSADARIEKLEAQLQAMQDELAKLKAEKAAPPVDQKQLKQLVEKTFEEKKDELGVVPDWVKNVKIGGDFRYRHESIDAETNGDWARGQNRHRIRLRLNIDAKLDKEWDLGFRLASGSGDPASTNQSLEDSFSGKELWMDLAYFNWHPLAHEGLNVFGGKMKNPFYSAGENELIWDHDVNPEGMAAKYVIPFGERNKLYVNGGGFWVDESSGGVDTSLWGIQAYLKRELKNKRYFLAGASYYDYGNMQGRGSLQNTWSTGTSFFGNTVTGTNFASDYDIVEAFAEYGFRCAEMPVSVFGNIVQNQVASTDEDDGWLIGFKLNKAEKPRSWEFRYNYRENDADAVLGAFTDSDFIGGGTDGKGHELGLAYQLTKNVQAELTYFVNERDRNSGNNDDYRRLQVDMKYKF